LRHALSICLVIVTVLLAACQPLLGDLPAVVPQPPPAPTAAPSASPPPADLPVPLELTDIATDLEAPWDVVFTPDGTTYVTERDSGRLLSIGEDGEISTVQTFEVDNAEEGGLLGLAVSPTFADDGLLYVYRSTAQDNEVLSFVPGEDPEVILDGIPHSPIHNGGRIAFGPDGMLYVATGDAGQSATAQDPESLAGKILRLTPDGSIPADNPTPDSPVYALGLRDPQGLAWAPDGTMYASEFGPDRDDEINVITAGANYGWPEVTGDANVDGFVDPIFVQQPPDASWSGIAFVTDSAIPEWDGQLLVAALRGERLWRVPVDDPDGSEALFAGELGRLRTARQAPDGSVWLLTSNRDGRGTPAEGDDRIVRVAPAG
jgi:glucose/arabinose dehydrogenase